MPVLEIERLKKSFRAPDGETHTVIDVEKFSLEEKSQVAGAAIWAGLQTCAPGENSFALAPLRLKQSRG